MQSLIEPAQSILPEGDGRVQVPSLPTQNQTHHLPIYFSLAWMGVSSKGSCVLSLVPNVAMVHSGISKGWGQVEGDDVNGTWSSKGTETHQGAQAGLEFTGAQASLQLTPLASAPGLGLQAGASRSNLLFMGLLLVLYESQYWWWCGFCGCCCFVFSSQSFFV